MVWTILWGFFCSAVGYLWALEWNQSDEDITASLKSAWESFGGVLGGAAGNTLGNLIVMGGSSVLFAFNEALAVHVLREVGEEALDELAGQAAAVMQAAVPLATNYLFKRAFMKIRTAAGLNPDEAFLSDDAIKQQAAQAWANEPKGDLTGDALAKKKAEFEKGYFDKQKQGQAAIKGERKPWSFANQWEEYVEGVQKKNAFVGNFLENLFEETIDAIQDMGYVAFGAIDSYVAEHKVAHKVSTGDDQPVTVELTLDRSLDDDGTTTTTP